MYNVSINLKGLKMQPYSMIESIGFILSIVVAIEFCVIVKKKIQQKEELSGMGWGLLNGLFGVGLIWVIIAHSSINKEIDKIKSEKYANYAKVEMKDFVRTYSICLITWIVIIFLISSSTRN